MFFGIEAEDISDKR